LVTDGRNFNDALSLTAYLVVPALEQLQASTRNTSIDGLVVKSG
jgi:hypothetical protein